MLVTDRRQAGGEDALVAAVDAAVGAGVDVVQLREKDLASADLLALAQRLRDVTQGRALLMVNNSLDVALASGADGVHLPEASAMVDRPSTGFLIGRSVHSLTAARRAESEGVDYMVAGPVYQTGSHAGVPPAGPTLVQTISSAVSVPVLAIGGIDAPNVAELLTAGATGIVVISAILGSPQPANRARYLRAALDDAWAAGEKERYDRHISQR